MLPPLVSPRYPEGNGSGGNIVDIENALPFAFAIPGIFLGEGRRRRGGEKRKETRCGMGRETEG